MLKLNVSEYLKIHYNNKKILLSYCEWVDIYLSHEWSSMALDGVGGQDAKRPLRAIGVDALPRLVLSFWFCVLICTLAFL